MTTQLPAQIWLHLLSILPAIALGIAQLILPKGTSTHRAVGRTWVILMLTTSISSFWIQRVGFSWIHGLSVVTIVSVIAGLVYARTGNRRAHVGCMLGAFLGSLGAGIGAVSPGRFLHSVLFGG
jgi:uncharacterized membrane protein